MANTVDSRRCQQQFVRNTRAYSAPGGGQRSFRLLVTGVKGVNGVVDTTDVTDVTDDTGPFSGVDDFT